MCWLCRSTATCWKRRRCGYSRSRAPRSSSLLRQSASKNVKRRPRVQRRSSDRCRSTASANSASGATQNGSGRADRRAVLSGMLPGPINMIVQSAVLVTDRISRQNSCIPLSALVQMIETSLEMAVARGIRYAAHCFNCAHPQNYRVPLIPVWGKLGVTSRSTKYAWTRSVVRSARVPA